MTLTPAGAAPSGASPSKTIPRGRAKRDLVLVLVVVNLLPEIEELRVVVPEGSIANGRRGWHVFRAVRVRGLVARVPPGAELLRCQVSCDTAGASGPKALLTDAVVARR